MLESGLGQLRCSPSRLARLTRRSAVPTTTSTETNAADSFDGFVRLRQDNKKNLENQNMKKKKLIKNNNLRGRTCIETRLNRNSLASFIIFFFFTFLFRFLQFIYLFINFQYYVCIRVCEII